MSKTILLEIQVPNGATHCDQPKLEFDSYRQDEFGEWFIYTSQGEYEEAPWMTFCDPPAPIKYPTLQEIEARIEKLTLIANEMRGKL